MKHFGGNSSDRQGVAVGSMDDGSGRLHGIMNEAPTGDAPAFLPRLEAARGVAAMLVACYHATAVTCAAIFPLDPMEATRQGGADSLLVGALYGIFNGFGAVIFFFVLSGFVLARSLDYQIDQDPRWLSAFCVSRLFRLAPASTAAIFIFVFVYLCFGINVYGAEFSAGNVALNTFMLRSDIDVVTWSLRVEWIATILIVVCVALYRARHGAWPAMLALALIGMSFVPSYDRLLGTSANLAPLYAFTFGVSIHFARARIASVSRAAPAILILCIATLCMCVVRRAFGLGPWVVLSETLATSLLLAGILYRQELRAWKILDTRAVRFYGRISYSFYLLHPLAFYPLQMLSPQIRSLHASGAPLAVLCVIGSMALVLLATPCAWLLWATIEKPGNLIGKYLSRPHVVKAARGRASAAYPN